MIKQRVAEFIRKNNLFPDEKKVLVALSGGADSVALLHILLELGYTCEAAHCNFHLRAEESDRDESFVTELCKQFNVPLHIIHFDTRVYAEMHKISIEMAARELRYQWFDKLRKNFGFKTTAIAHHKDDSVETILLNLIRGTGISGLTGIRAVNDEIVRPLLCISREEILEYLSYKKLSFVTDSTNLHDEYTRNKIRLKLIPLMQEINPSVKESIMSTGNHLNEAFKLYKRSVEESIERVRVKEGIVINTLLQEPSPKIILFEILYPLGFNSSQIDDIYESLTGQPGKQFISSQQWMALKDRETLYINKVENEERAPSFSLQMEELKYSSDFIIPHDKKIACLDADKVTQPFELRRWKKGDTFIPFGMKGKKKISDYLTDRKISLTDKKDQWVLCSGNEIVWLINQRIDNRFRIDENTKNIIVIRTIPTFVPNN